MPVPNGGGKKVARGAGCVAWLTKHRAQGDLIITFDIQYPETISGKLSRASNVRAV
jgi:hypothetical protein